METSQQTEVPVELARLWRLTPRPSGKGRPATLDVDNIVRTAVGLADEGGLEAASLPRIASALGVTTMSLYRHVGSRNELWGLMSDYAAHPVADVHPEAKPMSPYLAQSVAWLLLASPYALALGGRTGSPLLTAGVCAVAVWLLTVVGAAVLERFGRPGPAEVLLRRLSYGRPPAH